MALLLPAVLTVSTAAPPSCSKTTDSNGLYTSSITFPQQPEPSLVPWPVSVQIDVPGYVSLDAMTLQCGSSELYPLCLLVASEIKLATNGSVSLPVQNATTTGRSNGATTFSLAVDQSLSGEESSLSITPLAGIVITGAGYAVRQSSDRCTFSYPPFCL